MQVFRCAGDCLPQEVEGGAWFITRTDFLSAPCRFGGLELRLGTQLEIVNVSVDDFPVCFDLTQHLPLDLLVLEPKVVTPP